MVLLRPGLDDLRAYGLDLTTGAAPADLDRSWLFFPPAVSLTTLSLATTLAIAKPWGRVRSRPAATRR